MMIIRIKYLLLGALSFSLCSTIHCMDNPQSNEVLELVRTVTTEHTERLNRTEEQLNQLVENVTNLLNFTNTLTPIGAIMEYSGRAAVPDNWLECNGEYKRQDQYNELFQVIQDTYGPTSIVNINGSTINTFKLPDRRGYVAVGIGSDNSTGGRITTKTAPHIALGKGFGEQEHRLTMAEIPDHYHAGSSSGRYDTCRDGLGGNCIIDVVNVQPVGINEAHNNMQPSIFMKFYIRAK